MSSQDPVVIVSCARTPMGGFQGCFGELGASELGAVAIRAALRRSGLASKRIEEVIMGNVLMAGQGQAPARQAALGGGLALSANCTTINKMCGSGMKAVMLAHDLLIAGTNRIMIAGGMESMTNAPYLLPRARSGLRMGHGQVLDHMFHDGLEDAYQKGQLMGCFAELCADRYGFTREKQDEFAIRSLERARSASDNGLFDGEIAPVTVRTRKGETVVDKDEQPFAANIDRIPHLKPAFRQNGTVTPANSSSISDGASALLLMLESTAVAKGLDPLARIVSHATHAQDPSWFTTAPVGAIRSVLERAGWSIGDVDLFEVNEAFAVVTMAAMEELGIEADRMNIRGGACALGHPIGASGARILTTLISALEDHSFKKGVVSLCIGGGEATAMAVERC
ncbi:MAG: acetyl-CoA C-acyltransferase [Gammaproteobacteria bacterium]|nr:acetyl-CoA C-acyltransferase [Gammaproteobacteria bacterium]MYD75282.1 acetyl-CoA C-acyltransferase [Gammaproteobacteria bacterium]MYJ51115.1 acetyl-CoA C-acyltransferase [Gammaproteobacteria bacterium]